jgi:hypothetical protein
MTDHQRLYRRLLRLYPAEFRHEYENEMRRLFAEQLWDARRSGGGRKAIAALWSRTLLDLAATAPRQHLERTSRVRQPVEGPPVGLFDRRPPRPLRQVSLGLMPLLALLATGIASGASDGLLEKPPEALGLPLGVVLVGLGLGLMVIGLVALRSTSSARSAGLSLILFTAPATAILGLTTGLIATMQHLKT